MSAAASLPLLDAGSRALLQGLGALHTVVVAAEPSGRVVFVRDPDGLLGSADLENPNVSTRGTPAARAIVFALADARTQDETRPLRVFRTADEAHQLRVFQTADEAPQPLRVALLDLNDEVAAPSDELRRKNEELETCVRSVSHDLRSPLVSVLGFTRLLRDEFGEPIGRTGQHFLDRIEQAGKNMERLLHDLLELTRMEETPNTPVHVNPTAVLQQLAAEKKLALDEARITLAFQNETPVVVCDRTRLYQLFSNLIGNAIRFAPNDGSGRVDVRIEDVEDGWQLDVDDNGPGVAEQDRARIFDPFRTAKHARKSTDGKKSSGLGLAIVRKIVEAHDGRIHVEDAPSGGARFRIWLPRPSGE